MKKRKPTLKEKEIFLILKGWEYYDGWTHPSKGSWFTTDEAYRYEVDPYYAKMTHFDKNV